MSSHNVKHKLGDAKLTMEGVRDKLFGGVKQKVGHMLGKHHLEAEGRQQRKKGEEEMKHHRGIRELTAAEAVELHLHREALFSDIERSGGYARLTSSGRLHHIELHDERDVKKLFTRKGHGEKWQQFELKRFNKAPLLKDIRDKKTKRPLVHVDTKEKGLMRSIMLNKKGDFRLRSTTHIINLLADIRRADNKNRLRKVKSSEIRDRSAPRLDLLRSVGEAKAKREEILKQIETVPKRLNHVSTNDKSRPELYFDKDSIGTGVKKINKAELLNEVRQGTELKHVQTDDKSVPAIGDAPAVRTWNKEGFLAEVRQGTELKHI